MQVSSAAQAVEVGGLEFRYDDRVLTPRPWTEAQSRWARRLLAELPDGPVLELCSGAGHIGALALLGNDRSLVMVDASNAACDFAGQNLRAAGLDARVEDRHATLEAALRDDETFVLVIADPPWVPSGQVGQFPEDPVTAIDGGVDGLRLARACLEVASRHLADDGRCLLQLGRPAQVSAIRTFLETRPGLGLEVVETRTFDRGVLVLLRRTGGGAPC